MDQQQEELKNPLWELKFTEHIVERTIKSIIK